MKISKYLILGFITFLLFLATASSNAQATHDKYCIDGICLFDSISKFKNEEIRNEYSRKQLYKAVDQFPICTHNEFNIAFKSKSGYKINLTLQAIAAPKGQHYVVTDITADVDGNFTREQINETFLQLVKRSSMNYKEDKIGNQFIFQPQASINENGLGIYLAASKDQSYLNSSKKGMSMRYSTNLGAKNTDNLARQPGCNSQTPTM